MSSIDCDVLVAGGSLHALAAAVAAAEAGARTVLLGVAVANDEALLAAVLAEKARRSDVDRISGEIVRIVRHRRRIVMVVTTAAEIRPRIFTDARTAVDAPDGLLPAVADRPCRGEFIDTMAVGMGPVGRLALPYRAVVVRDLDNELRPIADLPEPLGTAVAHATGVAAALLAASGQRAGDLDPATLRERLRDAGASF